MPVFGQHSLRSLVGLKSKCVVQVIQPTGYESICVVQVIVLEVSHSRPIHMGIQ